MEVETAVDAAVGALLLFGRTRAHLPQRPPLELILVALRQVFRTVQILRRAIDFVLYAGESVVQAFLDQRDRQWVMSIPIQRRLSFCAAWIVVPHPQNGSSTMSPSFEDDRIIRQHSAPVMEELHGWLQAQLAQKKTEPNSALGKATNYMLRHWKGLTVFLRQPGSPIDNNLCEQVLKRAVLHRLC